MKDGKKVIARVFSAYDGPADYYLLDRMKMVDSNKFKTICIFLKKRSDTPNPLEKEGFKCFYVSRQRYFKIFNIVAIFKLARIFKENKVDVLHCNRHQATMYSVIASIYAKVPIILSHVHGMKRAKKLCRRLFYRIFGRKVFKFMAVSKAVAEDIISTFSVDESQIIIFDNSIDYDLYANADIDRNAMRHELGVPSDSFTFIAVGRIVPTKGYEYLIDAFAGLRKICSNVHLVIVGDGRTRADIEKQIIMCNLSESVTLTGHRKNVPQILKACDAFVLSSIREAFGLVILEAMAAGLPVIVTDSGGPSEVVDDQIDGFVVPPANSEKLTEAMLNIRAMPENELKGYVERASKKVRDNYSHNKLVLLLQEVYSMRDFSVRACHEGRH